MLKFRAYRRLYRLKDKIIFWREVKLLSVIISFVVLYGCVNELSKQDYVRWVRNYDNGLHVQKEVGVFSFDIQYQPSDYLKLVNQGNSVESNQSDSMQYYVLRIGLAHSKDDIINYQVQSISEKQQRLYYFSYLFQNSIYLEDGGVKHSCALFHFEQSDLEGARTFVLGFPQSQGGEPCLIIDSPIFGSLPVKIKIYRHDIPTVKL